MKNIYIAAVLLATVITAQSSNPYCKDVTTADSKRVESAINRNHYYFKAYAVSDTEVEFSWNKTKGITYKIYGEEGLVYKGNGNSAKALKLNPNKEYEFTLVRYTGESNLNPVTLKVKTLKHKTDKYI